MKFYQSRLVKNQKLNSHFHHLFFKLINQKFSFKPGQFIILKVSDSVSRAYSIASQPSTLPLWEIILDTTPAGPGSTYLKNLKEGQIINTSAPQGHLYYHPDQSKNIILIATGCGFASIKSIIEYLLSQPIRLNIYLLWGLRYQKDIFLKKTLDTWNKIYPHFNYDITLSHPSSSYRGKSGHVDTHLQSIAHKYDLSQSSFYLCGNQKMIKDIQKALLKFDIPPNKIYFENYY